MSKDVSRLPKWAQELIDTLKRERNTAIAALNKAMDDQTPSSMYIDDWVCTGESSGPTVKRRYIQGNTLNVIHDGVSLSITLRSMVIDLKWCQSERGYGGDVCFQPCSYQNAYLFTKERML